MSDHSFDSPPPGNPPAAPARRRSSALRFFLVLLAGMLAGGLLVQCAAVETDDDQAEVLPQGTSTPRELPEGSIAAVVEQLSPSIVAVFTQRVGIDFFFETVPAQGAGTGIVASEDGHILTNAHVVEGAQEIEVLFTDGRELPAQVVGSDPETDLAVIKVEATDLTPATFGDSDLLIVGEQVVAMGHALGLSGGPTVTAGIVSALDRSIRTRGAVLQHLIQTDAAINPGNSGGALTDMAGNVVGVNTAIAGNAQNIGFAIAITPSRSIVEQLIETGQVIHPFLGIQMIDNSTAIASREDLSVSHGVVIIEVVVGSPAQEAGLQANDVVIEVDGEEVTRPANVSRIINSKRPGDSVELELVRGTDTLTISATLAERPQQR